MLRDVAVYYDFVVEMFGNKKHGIGYAFESLYNITSHYVNGYRHGKYVELYRFIDSIRYTYRSYEYGLINGTVKIVDGDMLLMDEYKNDKKHGKCLEYRKDKLRSSVNYRFGIRHGESVYYDPDGKITMEVEYFCDEPIKETKYNKKGQVICKKDNDYTTFYYPDGTIRCTGMTTCDDAKYGEWKYYDRSGQLTRTHTYYCPKR